MPSPNRSTLVALLITSSLIPCSTFLVNLVGGFLPSRCASSMRRFSSCCTSTSATCLVRPAMKAGSDIKMKLATAPESKRLFTSVVRIAKSLTSSLSTPPALLRRSATITSSSSAWVRSPSATIVNSS